MDKPIGSIRKLLDDHRKALLLECIAGQSGLDEPMATREKAASPDLIGYLNLIHPGRIQVYGRLEVAYFERLDLQRREHILDELIASHAPAIIAADGFPPVEGLAGLCEQHAVPLLQTSIEAARVIEILRAYLSKHTAITAIRHGVLMDVFGVGVLITGESGLGKSELALELVSRGHGLVADDVVELSRISPTTIEGRCPRLLANLLEVRGLGVLDMRAIFGETAVRRKMRLKLIVHLVRGNALENEYQRLPLDTLAEEIMGMQIPKVVIPVAAGRNIAVLLEAAVRNTILQLRGIDTMQDFMDRQTEAMQGGNSGSDH